MVSRTPGQVILGHIKIKLFRPWRAAFFLGLWPPGSYMGSCPDFLQWWSMIEILSQLNSLLSNLLVVMVFYQSSRNPNQDSFPALLDCNLKMWVKLNPGLLKLLHLSEYFISATKMEPGSKAVPRNWGSLLWVDRVDFMFCCRKYEKLY
jgi:hypothetical protein